MTTYVGEPAGQDCGSTDSDQAAPAATALDQSGEVPKPPCGTGRPMQHDDARRPIRSRKLCNSGEFVEHIVEAGQPLGELRGIPAPIRVLSPYERPASPA